MFAVLVTFALPGCATETDWSDIQDGEPKDASYIPGDCVTTPPRSPDDPELTVPEGYVSMSVGLDRETVGTFVGTGRCVGTETTLTNGSNYFRASPTGGTARIAGRTISWTADQCRVHNWHRYVIGVDCTPVPDAHIVGRYCAGCLSPEFR